MPPTRRCSSRAVRRAAAAQELPAPLPREARAVVDLGDGLRVRVSDMEARIRTRLHMDLLGSNLEDVGAALEVDDAKRLRRGGG